MTSPWGSHVIMPSTSHWLPKWGFQCCFIVSFLFASFLAGQSTLQSANTMQALARGFREGGSSLLPRLLPALGVTASSAGRITTTAAAPAAQAEAAAPSDDGLQREFLVYRWSPETGGKPRYDSYKVDINRLVQSYSCADSDSPLQHAM